MNRLHCQHPPLWAWGLCLCGLILFAGLQAALHAEEPPPAADRQSAAEDVAAPATMGLIPGVSEDALHRQIDEHIAGQAVANGVPIAGPASDAEFLRRAYLDLLGRIPSLDEAQAFLADDHPLKRSQLIDRLLADEEHPRHLAEVFDVMLMERRPATHVKNPVWQEYLRKSFAQNKPLNELVRELLAADGRDPATRPAAKFALDREVEPNLLTRDIGRLLLGVNLTCAQCHDHPVISDYYQEDYYGIYAFVSRSYLFDDKKNKTKYIAEKAEGEATFKSVFEPKAMEQVAGLKVLRDQPLMELVAPGGEPYQVKPTKTTGGVPLVSRRLLLAETLPTRQTPDFSRNMVNRLWAQMMGRGIVHPLDEHHGDNPPSHPELLELLARRFEASDYDVRWLLRELALSETYQRSSQLPPGTKAEAVPPESFAVMGLKPLSAEQFASSLLEATGEAALQRAALGDKLTEATEYEKLTAVGNPILQLFAGPPGEPDTGLQASLDQSLFLRNGGTLRGWLNPRGGNLTDRLAKLTDSTAVAEELYLATLTRQPDAEERKLVADLWEEHPDQRPELIRELAWALLTSAEFRFNH